MKRLGPPPAKCGLAVVASLVFALTAAHTTDAYAKTKPAPVARKTRKVPNAAGGAQNANGAASKSANAQNANAAPVQNANTAAPKATTAQNANVPANPTTAQNTNTVAANPTQNANAVSVQNANTAAPKATTAQNANALPMQNANTVKAQPAKNFALQDTPAGPALSANNKTQNVGMAPPPAPVQASTAANAPPGASDDPGLASPPPPPPAPVPALAAPPGPKATNGNGSNPALAAPPAPTPALSALASAAKPASGGLSAPAPAAALTPAADPNAPDVSYDVKLRQIEQRVSELKEKVFQSKARLLQLQEVVLRGSLSGAKAVLVHRNEMGSSFRLIHAQYALDGVPIFNRVDDGNGELDKQAEFEVFNGATAPGTHQISVLLEYGGYGYGVFSYLQGYKFRVKSSYTFNAEENKVTTVRVVGFEKGGLTTELKDRPAVRYDIDSSHELQKANAAPSSQESVAPVSTPPVSATVRNVAPAPAPAPAASGPATPTKSLNAAPAPAPTPAPSAPPAKMTPPATTPSAAPRNPAPSAPSPVAPKQPPAANH